MVTVTAGCSLISDDAAARSVDDLPEDLFSTTTTPTTVLTPEFVLPLYFTNTDNQLVRIDREVDTPPTFQDALDQLREPPTEEESAQQETGTRTRFPSDMEPQGQLSEGVLQVTVIGESLRIESESEDTTRVTLVYQQVVCTMAALDQDLNEEGVQGIDQIRIVDEDEDGVSSQIKVQIANGEVIDSRPVGPADFNNCQTAAEAEAEAAEGGDGDAEGEAEGEDDEPSSPVTRWSSTTSSTTSSTVGPGPGVGPGGPG